MTDSERSPSQSDCASPTDVEVGTDPDASNIIPVGHKSQFFQFIKSLASFTGDLSQMTCPSFLLSGVSLLEYSTHWADHPDLFADIPNHSDPLLRMLAVTRWFLSTLYGSFHSRCKTGTEKKPFNPVLGEQFFCSWPGTGVVPNTRLVVEQVSHHPPVGAFYIENDNKNIYLNGHCGQKTKFKSTYIKCEQTGRVVVSVHLSNGQIDEYFITLPEMALRGLLTGQLFVELLGKSTITSASGYQTVIEYVPKGWFGGQYHTIMGQIAKLNIPLSESCGSNTSLDESKSPSKKKSKQKLPQSDIHAVVESAQAMYKISGVWTTRCMATNIQTQTQEVLFDADKHPMAIPTCKPIPDQGELESRKLWHKVANALQMGDYANATILKSAIEDEQRNLRKDRASRGLPWSPSIFTFVPDLHPICASPASSQTSPTTPTFNSPLSVESGISSSTMAMAPTKVGSDLSSIQARTSLREFCIVGASGSTGTDALVDEGSWMYVAPK